MKSNLDLIYVNVYLVDAALWTFTISGTYLWFESRNNLAQT